VAVDCADPYALAVFWAHVLGSRVAAEAGPGDPWVVVPAGGSGMLFGRVPEGKAVKNRLHLDLEPSDGTCDAEVARLLHLGAVHLADMTEGPLGWVVLADPEGNEFCVLRSVPECAV
jgi:predicted enzyme related to lactoylglutathione lyase